MNLIGIARVPYVVIGVANGEERTIRGIKEFAGDMREYSDSALIDAAILAHTIWPEGLVCEQWGPVERPT